MKLLLIIILLLMYSPSMGQKSKNTTSQPFYLTNNISYLYEKNPRRYKTYFYKGKNIIKIESRYEVYSSEALAIVSDEVKYKFKEPTDVKIWTKDKKELVLTITIPWLDKLIGWI